MLTSDIEGNVESCLSKRYIKTGGLGITMKKINRVYIYKGIPVEAQVETALSTSWYQ